MKIVELFGKVNKAVIGIKDKNLGLSIEKQICRGEVI